MSVNNLPLFTDAYILKEFVPEKNSAYVFGTSVEDRSAHSEEWEARASEVEFVRIVSQGVNIFGVEVRGAKKNVLLRSSKKLSKFFQSINKETIYIDITGLAHHIWAPLLRAALRTGAKVLAVYVEPYEYTQSSTAPEEEKLTFELSEERINVISPIPGFTVLTEVRAEKVCFVPLLGFEGARLRFIIEKVQPPGEKIIPIIGSPGFRAEYPFYTFHGNQSPLTETKAWKNVRFAKANCPFSLFYLLQEIESEYPDHLLKIAPIGTKPHALGAVMYAIHKGGAPVELVYDHPVRKANRTKGTARLLVYHVSALAFSKER